MDSDAPPVLAWAGTKLTLLPSRAVWWPDGETLFVADLHLGKGDVFRSAGIPIPTGTTRDDLARLAEVVRQVGAVRVVVLGDFFHGAASRSPRVLEALMEWRRTVGQVDALLVRGNHDRHAGDPPPVAGFSVVEGPFHLGPFSLRHEPLEPESGSGHLSGSQSQEGAGDGSSFTLAGHLHPAVRLQGTGRDRLRLPCFWVQPHQLILPAFGGFTGSARIQPGRQDRIYVVGPDGVLQVPVR